MSVRTDVVNLRVIVNGNAAKKELASLDQEYIKLKNELKNLKKGTDEYIAANKRMDEVQSRMKTLRSQIGLTAMNLRELNAEARRLRAMKQYLTPGTDAFRDNEKQLIAVNNRIKELNSGLTPFAAAWKKVSLEAKAAVAILSAGFAANQFMNLIKGAEDFDEAIADVSKVTSLTAAQISDLNKELSQMETRSSRKELMDLAYEAGKLGNQSTEDVLSFVKAADQIKIALGRDLGDSAITSIGKMVDIFKLKEDFGLEKGMLKIASVINDVGMSSTATETYLVDFAKRMSGVANVAKITAPEIIGLAGTLDSLGQTSEVSSTALSKLLTKMGGDMETFARMANMSVKDFRALMGESGLKALLKVIEEMGKSGGGLEVLAAQLGDIGMDGGRVVGVLGTLSANMDEVRRQTEIANKAFEDGTSITDEFNIKNATLGATLAKTRRELMGMIITERVKNAIKSMVMAFSESVKWVKENGDRILFLVKNLAALLTVYVSYKATVIGLNLLLKLNAYWQMLVAVNTSKATVASKLNAIAFRLDAIATTALSVAKALLAGNMRKVAVEYKLLTTLMKGSPLGILVSVITAAAAAFYLYSDSLGKAKKQIDSVADAQAIASVRTQQETERLKALKAQLEATAPGSKARQEVIDAINQLYPDLLANMDLEKASLSDITTEIDNYIAAMGKKMELQVLEEKLQEAFRKKEEILSNQDLRADQKSAQIKEIEHQKNLLAARLTDLQNENTYGEKYVQLLKEQTKLKEKLNTLSTAEAAEPMSRSAYKTMSESAGGFFSEAAYTEYVKSITESAKEHESTKNRIAAIDKEIDRIINDPSRPKAKISNVIGVPEKKEKDDLKKIYDDIAQFLLDKQEELATELFDGEDRIIYETTKQYREKFMLVKDAEQKIQLEKLMTAELEEKLRQYAAKKEKEFAEERKKAAEEITDTLMTEQERKEAALIRHYDSLIELNKKYNITEVDLELEKQKALAKLREEFEKKEKKGLETWQDRLSKKAQAIEGLWSQISSTISSVLTSLENRENAELANFKKNQDAKLQKLEQRLAAGLISEEQYAEEKANIERALYEKERKLKQEQWRRQKEADIIAASVKAALAVVTALASSVGPPMNFVLAAATGVAGAAQVAAIASQPEPQFGRGAIFDGPSHQSSHKGMPVVDPVTGKTQAYFEGGEGLIPKKAVEKNRTLVEALIAAGRKDGYLSPVNFRNITRSLDTLALAKGGYYQHSSTTANPSKPSGSYSSSSDDVAIQELININKKMLAAIQEEKTRPAVVSNRQWEKTTEERNRIRRLAGA